jgi:DNA repair photolyase
MAKKTGTKEWAETNINFMRGCKHNCIYCYAREMLVERFKIIKPKDWATPVVNQKVVDAPQGKKLGTVMLSSSHDIDPEHVSEFLTILRKLLEAGNDVLIVSKPHLEVIKLICGFYHEYQNQIMFRFTIGSTDSEILRFWEPGAPDFEERLECLKFAYKAGFQTSISAEPFLDAYVVYLYEACKPFITDSFWIGTMKGFNSRLKHAQISPEQRKQFIEPLERLYSPSVLRGIYRLLNGRPGIRWKDSVQDALGIENK